MNKDKLIDSIAQKHGLTKKDARAIVADVLDEVKDALGQGHVVSLHGFGTFKVKATAARAGRNPQTGEPLQIPAGKKVAFIAAPTLKASV